MFDFSFGLGPAPTSTGGGTTPPSATNVANPTFSPPSGTQLIVGQAVVIASATPLAVTHKAVDGGADQLGGSHTFTTIGAHTIVAFATKQGLIDSDTVSGSWEVVAAPVSGGGGTPTGRFVTLPLSVENQSTTTLTAGDTAPDRAVRLTDGAGNPFPIPAGATISYRLKKRGASVLVQGNATILYGPLGLVVFEWSDAKPIPEAGFYHEEWFVIIPGLQNIRFPSNGFGAVTIKENLG